MIDRREMLRLVAVGAVGAAVVGELGHVGDMASVRDAQNDAVRFSVEGDMGVVRATSAGQSIRVSGQFAERTVFTLG